MKLQATIPQVISITCQLFGIQEQGFLTDTSCNAEDCRAAVFGFLVDRAGMSPAKIATMFRRSRSSVALTIDIHRDRVAMYGFRERQYRVLYRTLEEDVGVVEPDRRPTAKIYHVDALSTQYLREYMAESWREGIDVDSDT